MRKYLLVIMILILALPPSIYIYLRRSLPEYSGSFKHPLLSNEVEVTRDKYAIPHINAKNKQDLYRIFGQVMAQDRLFQMDIYRRLSNGELSEILGIKTLRIDKLFKTLGFKRWAIKRLKDESFPKDLKKHLSDFTMGVNFHIKNHPLTYEFDLLGYKPKDFTMQDSLAYIGYMAYSFAYATKQEVLYEKLKTLLSENLYRNFRDLKSLSVKKVTKMSDFDKSKVGLLDSIFDETLGWLGRFNGSNAWLLSGKRTKSGFPILANDPHIGFSSPGIWYEAHLKVDSDDPSEKFEVYGHFLPIMPIAVLGHNKDYGWGMTMSTVDDMDLYKEEVDFEKKKVLYKDEWRKLKAFKEIIKVKDSDDYVLDILHTPNGILLNEVLDIKNISLKWTFYLENNKPVEAFYNMARAKNMNEFKDAVKLGTSPGMNVLYADNKGNIAKWVFGAIPIRDDSIDGKEVLDGNLALHEYKGYISFEEKPNIVNPPEGLIVSANHKPIPAKQKVQGYWRLDDRYKSISRLLEKKEKWDLEGLKLVQTDNSNIQLKYPLKKIIENLDESQLDSYESNAWVKLKNWDFNHDIQSVGASIYHVFYKNLLYLIFDEIPLKERVYLTQFPNTQRLFRKLVTDKNNIWWDIAATSNIERMKDVIVEAFKVTVKELTNEYGKKLEKWTWGKLHTLEFVHPLGKGGGILSIFNYGPIPTPGGRNVTNSFQWLGLKNNHKVKSGPSTRRLIDFSSSSMSYGILPLGISGHHLSKHAYDQTELFLKGDYRPQLLDKTLIDQTSVGKFKYYAK